MEDFRFTAIKWRIDLLERQVEEMNSRIMDLSESRMWLSIAFAVISLAWFVHVVLLH